MEWFSAPVAGGIAFAALGLVAAIGWKPWRLRRKAAEVREAVRRFRFQREMLEAKFFDLASTLGKPRGLRWLDCEWHDEVRFARDVNSGLLTAFVGVNIRFEAIEGGDMEGVAAVSDIRDAAAVFHYRNGRWGTGGRALFNMDPNEAVVRLQGQFEPVQIEPSAPRV